MRSRPRSNCRLILGGAGKELIDLPYLGQRGVRVCLQGHQPFMAAVQAVYDTLHALRAGTPADKLQGVAPEALMKRVTRGDDYSRWTREFL
jgi:carboxyvinyl-carboxyphosphonate phosphorylmutase